MSWLYRVLTTMGTRNAPKRSPDHRAGRNMWLVRAYAQAAAAVLAAAMIGAVVFGHPWAAPQAEAASNQPWFAGYVDVTTTPQYSFENPRSQAGRDVFLSFVVADPVEACTPTWATSYTLDQAASLLDLDKRIARLRQRGGAVAVSFGGSLNDELAATCTDHARLVDAYQSVVDRYGVTTVDLDIEGYHLTDHAAGARRAAAMKDLQTAQRSSGESLAVWMTLPVSPTGLNEDGRLAVTQMLDAGVDVAGVNAMTMNYGQSRASGDSMIHASLSALTSAHGQLKALYRSVGMSLSEAGTWKKLGATPMIGQNEMPGEVFGLAAAEQLNAFALARGLGRVSMWSLNRDKTCPVDHLDVSMANHACSGIGQGERSFADILSVGLHGSFVRAAGIQTAAESDGAAAVIESIRPNP